MEATFIKTLASGLAVFSLTVAIAISSAPSFARDLPGGAREPSPAGNVQGVHGAAGCRGAACNVKGPNPAGNKGPVSRQGSSPCLTSRGHPCPCYTSRGHPCPSQH